MEKVLLTKEVVVKWHCKNYKRYIELGYKFTKFGDSFIVPVEHLPKGDNKTNIDVKCDCCGDVIQRTWYKYLKHHDEEFGDTCNYCAHNTKLKRTVRKLYGVDNCSQSEIIKDKKEQTTFKHYGVKNPFQAEDFQEKSKQIRLELYGNEIYNNSEQMKQTKFERYGNENYNNMDKNRQTCLERYGVENGGGSEESVSKAWETKRKNGNINSSQPERDTISLLKEIFNNDICTPQKKLSYYSLDCELIINGNKIDVEYNGQYWHTRDKAMEKDKKRRDFILSHGYKILNINGNREIPNKEQVLSAIKILLNSDENIFDINLDIY